MGLRLLSALLLIAAAALAVPAASAGPGEPPEVPGCDTYSVVNPGVVFVDCCLFGPSPCGIGLRPAAAGRGLGDYRLLCT